MLDQLNKVDSLSDTCSIKFGGIGLRAKKDVTSWLALNSPGERGGLVVNFHNLMEHVQNIIMGQDVITKLNSVYKLKIQTISQCLTISSFERTIPRIFHVLLHTELSTIWHLIWTKSLPLQVWIN